MAMTGGVWSPDEDLVDDPASYLAAMAASISALVENLAPAGMMAPYAGATAPDGWLFCNGQQVSRETYSALFAAIGTTHGGGNGTTTFNVPDMRGRLPIGLNTNDQDFSPLGKRDGAKSVKLKTSQIPPHSHGVYGGDNGTIRLRSGRGSIAAKSGTAYAPWFGTGYNSKNNVNTSRIGGDDPVEILPPYVTVNYIIKI